MYGHTPANHLTCSPACRPTTSPPRLLAWLPPCLLACSPPNQPPCLLACSRPNHLASSIHGNVSSKTQSQARTRSQSQSSGPRTPSKPIISAPDTPTVGSLEIPQPCIPWLFKPEGFPNFDMSLPLITPFPFPLTPSPFGKGYPLILPNR